MREPPHLSPSHGHGLGPTVFWGHVVARGRESGAQIASPRALIQMGDWCGSATRAVATRTKTGMRNQTTAESETNEKKHEKCYRTGVRIDTSLLMGDPFPSNSGREPARGWPHVGARRPVILLMDLAWDRRFSGATRWPGAREGGERLPSPSALIQMGDWCG